MPSGIIARMQFMNRQSLLASLLVLAFSLPAGADVWKWVDANGKTHFVDTMKPIYTWIDEYGKVHYGDTPDHEDAVAVQLVWVSSGPLKPATESAIADGKPATKSADDAYYCERATEALASYLNAPQLYRTNEAGEREILSQAEAAATITETRKKKEEYCQ